MTGLEIREDFLEVARQKALSTRVHDICPFAHSMLIRSILLLA